MNRPAQQSQFRGGSTSGAGTRPGSPFQIGRYPGSDFTGGLPRLAGAVKRNRRLRDLAVFDFCRAPHLATTSHYPLQEFRALRIRRNSFSW
jgi:hypothetical protein